MKNLLKNIGTLSSLIMLACLNAYADREILFMDFNMASDELARMEEFAKTESAQGRPTHLVVIPETRLEDRAIRKNLRRQMDGLGYEASSRGCSEARPCADIERRFEPLAARLREINGRYRKSTDEIRDMIRAACVNRRFDRIVLSGHDGTGDFYGDIGSMPLNRFQEVVRENSTCLGSSVRGIYLWGCYTATPKKMSCIWPQLFPQAEFVAGYDQMSPRSDRPDNLEILSQLMQRQDRLTQELDTSRLQRTLDAIPEIQRKSGVVYLPQCDRYYRSRSVTNLTTAQQRSCARPASERQARQNLFNCYFHAQPQCANPPENTNSSPLRETYNYLQQYEACYNQQQGAREACQGASGSDIPDVDRTVRLIFYRNVLDNFAKNESAQISRFEQSLSALGLSPDRAASLRLPSLRLGTSGQERQSNRRQILDWAIRTRQALSGLPESPTTDNFKRSFERIEASLVRLECVPFGWVEPDAHIPSEC